MDSMKVVKVLVLILVNISMELYGQCSPEVMERIMKERDEIIKSYVLNKLDMPNVEYSRFVPSSNTYCIGLSPLTETQFLFLTEGFQHTDLVKSVPSECHYKILYCESPDTKALQVSIIETDECKRAMVKRNESLRQNANSKHFQVKRVRDLISAKKEILSELKKEQKRLSTDIINDLGDIIVAELPMPSKLEHLASPIIAKLKAKGIKKVSDFYEIDYVPSQNENAEYVRQAIEPLDKALSSFNVPVGKYLKYWEAVKLSPSGGKIIGNALAKVRIYFITKDLENEIQKDEEFLNELEKLQRVNTYQEKTKEGIYLSPSSLF